MSSPTNSRAFLPAVLVGALTFAFALTCIRFVWQPSLATFADDSVSYLVMAQVFSPWQAAVPPVAEAFAREAFYPPLYPLLLALAGAGHDLALAHALTAVLLALCLPALYVLAARWLADRRLAVAVVAVVALLPSLWIHVKGTLSEPLFALLLLVSLILIDSPDRERRPWLLALALAGLVLTRTVGLVPVAAYAVCCVVERGSWGTRARRLLPVVAALAAYAAWVLVRPAATSDTNAHVVADHVRSLFAGGEPWRAFAALFARQARSMAEAWTGALMLFWVEGQLLRVVLAGVVGALALGGLGLRLALRKPDAWMCAAYLATFLLWPFQDQMTRFVFPVVPVLVLYAFFAVDAIARSLQRAAFAAHALLATLILSLAVPAMAFIHQRSRAAGPEVQITDWYRTPDLTEARRRASIQLGLMQDMLAIRELTAPEDRVMWVSPSYIALLAGRRGVPAPAAELAVEDYRRAVFDAKADYVLLTEYHPRDTIRDTAWRAGVRALRTEGRVVHLRERAPGATAALLIRVDPAAARLMAAAGAR